MAATVLFILLLVSVVNAAVVSRTTSYHDARDGISGENVRVSEQAAPLSAREITRRFA
jgi:hypothetical protein